MAYDIFGIKPACAFNITPVVVREAVSTIVQRLTETISFRSVVLLNEVFFIEFTAVIDFGFRHRCFATHTTKSFLFLFC